MSSKDKEAQISKSKFKLFFKTSKNAAGSTGERSLRPEIERELRPETPVAQRCKTLKELGDQHLYNLNLEDSSIIKLWDLTKDLIVPNKPAEYRQTTLIFYKKLIHSQYKNLNLLREHFFLVIQNHEVPEDLKHRLELLDTLTDNGKDIKNFEEKIGKFLLLWIPAITEANLLRPYLDMLVNLIKWNAAHLDTDIVVGIVQNACHLSCTVEDNEIGLQCLTILELVMSYTIFPCEPLPQCVVTLCRTVNHVPYCQASWKIMKNLLGTQLGFYSMKMMCNILNDSTLYEDQQLLRGAVFHLNMNIFASNVSFQVSAMFYASTVLTSFLHALESRHVIVTYEVILSARKVVNKYKTELPEIIWDRICDILSAIANNIDHYEQTNLNKDTLQHLQVNFHENVDFIEKLLQDEKTKILANFDRIYDLIERVAESRPEASVLHLIEYRASKVTATRPEWLQLLNNFVRRFYKMSNTNIRVKTIQSLVRIMDLNRSSYEEEILERVIIPHFSQITSEPDVQIRVAVAKALVDFARHCDTKRCGELLDILEKIMNRPFEQYQAAIATGAIDTNEPFFINESEILDAITAVDGLIDVFIIKLYRLPSCHAIKIFNILVSHLEMHYQKPKVFELVNCVRFKIFNWMLKARANGSYHIGYPDAANNDVIKFSYYLGIDSSLPLYGMTHQHQRQQVGSQLLPQEIIPSAHFTTISIRRACKIIVRCLESDRDFQIFQLVIKELPKVLQNKALIQGNDIEALANALFKIFTDKSAHLSYKPTTDEFYALVLPAIASLVIYHQSIAPSYQASVTKALSAGIFSGSANVCINAMTIMILEMKETFMRLLPDILLQMSKMSDTTAVAIPVLEFLSILSRLNNNIFTNFITRQYMYVFAISLPYTKPHRYDHYTVSLAHHVIAGWFLKVKLEYRKNIVAYIISSIQSNASMLYEDINKLTRNIQRQDLNSLNEDSSNRKRSTSLTERGSRNSNVRNDSDMRPLMNDSLKSFHTELAETCIDFLARHTFSPCSALPKRLPAVDYLLKDGLSQTWLVGNNLVTITTAGCPSAPTRNGLCDRCLQIGKATQFTAKSETVGTTVPPPLSPEIGATTTTGTVGAEAAGNTERRYTKVSLQHSSGNESAGSTDLTSSTSTSSSHHAASHASTQRQTSNSSTASFEALSRRGSNPDADLHSAAGGSMLGTSMQQLSTPISGSSSQLQVQQPICIRSCTGWAEIHVRRPTGNISWITRIQNPIANDCFGHDMPFSNVASLFLPTLHGGVFGPDFVEDAKFLSPRVSIGPEISSMSNAADGAVGGATSSRESLASNAEEQRVTAAKVVAKVRALQRQEEITSASASTAAIDIPKAVKRVGKEALSGSVSDGEADEEGAAFDDGTSKSRNPVRRVNSSPEMSSSWRSSFLANKPRPLSKELSNTEITGAAAEVTSLDVNSSISGSNEQLQKKKTVGYSKDMRVSCEAIPEEIAGSTPPSLTDSLKASNLQQPESSATDDKTTTASDFTLVQKSLDLPNRESTVQVPLKQHSADDVTQQMSTLAVGGGGPAVIPVQTSLSATSLKITPKAAAAAQKITAKPPLSPAPLSPRMLAKNSAHHLGLAKSSSSGGANNNGGNGNNNNDNNVGGGGGSNSSDYNNGDGIRGRSKTISVVREVNGKSRPASSNFRFGGQNKPPQINAKLCMNPSFVFMQLYHTGQQQVTDVPMKVPPENMNAVSLLDLTPPFETHTIGVLYVGQGQCNNEVEMLRNSYGSARYVEFLRSIGTLVSLKSAKENNLFIMMETDGPDGKFAYIWKDDIVQVTFHVATLMPTNLKKDPNCYEKKKHIGNDYVSIIYNESGEEYNLNTIGTQFNYACVIVQPLELNTNRIYVKARPEIAKYVCHPDAKIVSDSSAPLLARQMALHANLAALVYQSVKKKNPYASNWLERLRLIKRLRTKLENQSIQQPVGSAGDIDDNSADPLNRQNTNRDFTKYT